jgi:hypothetical protein
MQVAERFEGECASSAAGAHGTCGALSTQTGAEIWVGQVQTAGTTVTLALSVSATSVAANISEWSSLSTTADGTNSHGQSTGTTVSPGSITTTAANDLVISIASSRGLTAVSDPGSPWTALTATGTSGGLTGSNTQIGEVYQILVATGSFNPSFTVASTAAGAAVAGIKHS